MESNGDEDLNMKEINNEYIIFAYNTQKINLEKLYLVGESERNSSLRIQNKYQVQPKDFERFFYHFFDDVFSEKIHLADMDEYLLHAFFRLGNEQIRKWMIEYFWKEYRSAPQKEDIFKFYFGLSFWNIRGHIFTQDLRIKPFNLELSENPSEREKKIYEDTFSLFQWLGLSEFKKNSFLVNRTCFSEMDKVWLHNKVLNKLENSWSEIRKLDPKLKEEISLKKNSYSMFDHLVLRRQEESKNLNDYKSFRGIDEFF